ncbi:terpene synthase family protein [Streptomyces coeruleorubidus]|uniref:terpene synthase family protein n=1 Tax=Streptomyces coeruleorubidus TaxID=116188 RepID=UPI003816286E
MDRQQRYVRLRRGKGLGRRHAQHRFLRPVAPVADDDRLLATALWVYWGFGFDDARCDQGPLSTRPAQFNALACQVQRACETGTAIGKERYIGALQDIMRRFRSLATPTQVSRFTHAHRAWLSGVAWRIGNQALGRMPGLDDFLTMRLLSAGGEPTLAMLEIATGAEVPTRDLHRPAVRALTEMAMLVASLDNDRHSLHKELARDHADQNIYTVLMQEHIHVRTAASGVAAPAAMISALWRGGSRRPASGWPGCCRRIRCG